MKKYKFFNAGIISIVIAILMILYAIVSFYFH